MSHYETTKARIFQWIGIVLVVAVFAGAYWYFQVYGSTVNAPQNDSLTSGLVGLWSFNGDDISGTTAYDRSGSGNNGTLTNGPTTTEGKVGQALNFDGTNDYVQIPSSANYNNTTSTWCAWFKTSGAHGAGTGTSTSQLVGRHDSSGSFNGVALISGTNGSVSFYGKSAAGEIFNISAGVLALNQWHHVCGVSAPNGSTASIYADGVLKASATVSAAWSFNNQVVRLADSIDTFWGQYNGSIDEVRVYNRALAATEVQSLYTLGQSDKVNSSVSQPQGTGRLDSGLSGYWKLDENTGTSAGDASTNGNTGTLTNGPTWIAGQIGSAVSFDGTNDYVSMGTAPSGITFAYNQPFTIAMWVKPTATVGASVYPALYTQQSTTNKFAYGITANNNAFNFALNKTNVASNGVTSASFTVGQWYHLVGTFDGGTAITFYVNAQSAGATSYTFGSISAPDGLATVGGDIAAANRHFNGSIDEPRLYNRALSADEVSQLYRLTTPTGVDTGLKGYWSFNGKDLSGTTAYDRSGSGNTGTLTNSPAIAEGKLGQALSLDGTDDDVVIPDSSSLDLSTQATVCFWYKQSASGKKMAFGKWLNTGDQRSYYLQHFTDDKIYWNISGTGLNNTSFTSTATFADTNWNYVCGTYNGGTSSQLVYMNGVSIAGTITGTVPASIYNSTTTVKTTYDGGNYNTGKIDEVRIYNRALSAAEIKSLYDVSQSDKVNSAVSQPQGTGRLDSGLAGYWKLDENTGTSAGDSSTNGITGTLTNGPTWTTGQIGSAVSFDGSNDSIVTGTVAHGIGTGDFTFATWAYKISDNANPYQGIMTNGDYSPAMYVEVSSGNWGGYWGSDLSAGSALSTATWYHLVMLRRGTTISFYKNGVQEPNTFTVSASMANSFMRLGSSSTAVNNYANVRLDDTRLYNRALSVDEISELYRLATPTGTDTGLKGYWSFNGKDLSGTTAYDRSGSGKNGTLVSGPTVTEGKLGQALSLSGTNSQYVSTPVPFTGSPANTSYSLWAYKTANNDHGAFYKIGNATHASGGDGLAFGVGAGITGFEIAGNNLLILYEGVRWIDTGVTFVSGWNHFVLVINGSKYPTLYRNGVQVFTTGTGTTPINIGSVGTAVSQIGGYTSATPSNRYWTGKLDEVRIYNRALSATEIAALYNSSR